jgi:hypothetical protein
VEKRKFLTIPGLELRLLGRPARRQSLYRLRYPGSFEFSLYSFKILALNFDSNITIRVFTRIPCILAFRMLLDGPVVFMNIMTTLSATLVCNSCNINILAAGYHGYRISEVALPSLLAQKFMFPP